MTVTFDLLFQKYYFFPVICTMGNSLAKSELSTIYNLLLVGYDIHTSRLLVQQKVNFSKLFKFLTQKKALTHRDSNRLQTYHI